MSSSSSKILTALSASRIKKLQSCSWSYWCTYKLKLPDRSNEGASRGTICHLIFELLGDPKHLNLYEETILRDSVFLCEPIKRLIHYHARKLSVNDADNLQLIDKMIMAGLHFDFFGGHKGKPSRSVSEESFDISVKEDNKYYRVRGFIDKLFLYKGNTEAIIRDFKSSKSVFKGNELSDNLQDLIYTLAVKKLYPNVEKSITQFLFLKFDLQGKGNVVMPTISDTELEGLEIFLSHIQSDIEQFDESRAKSNFAAFKSYPSDGTFGGLLMCGKDGFKQSRGQDLLDSQGQPIPAYICPFRKPLEYYVFFGEDEKIIKSCFVEDFEYTVRSLPPETRNEKRYYEGCPAWNTDFLD